MFAHHPRFSRIHLFTSLLIMLAMAIVAAPAAQAQEGDQDQSLLKADLSLLGLNVQLDVSLPSIDAPKANPERTFDDQLSDVAAVVPAFGGFFVDEERDTLNIYMTDPGALSTADSLVRKVFSVEKSRTEVLPAAYSFAALRQWYEQMRSSVLSTPGVVMTDIDDRNNRLTVGVRDDATKRAVSAVLAPLGIPAGVVNVEIRPAADIESSLTDRHRPLVGGLQLSLGGNCTLGVIARRQGVMGFVTASHCTATQGGVESTVYHQPAQAAQGQTSNVVGTEQADPTYFTGGSCPSGRRCRFSDTAWAEIGNLPTWRRGKIAQPGTVDSTAWNGTSTYAIVSEGDPPVGEALQKVGRSTGRTGGRVASVCGDWNQSAGGVDTGVTMLCQSQGTYGSAGGDSGSPVFSFGGYRGVELAGIHWGGGGVFSTRGQMQRSVELGILYFCDPTIASC